VNENDDGEAGAMEGALDREMAAETLRSVEGMRRRTIEAGVRPSAFPPLVFALAAFIASPFIFFTDQVWSSVALGLIIISAIGITDLHYQRQAVHPVRERGRRERSTLELVLIVMLVLFFGRFVMGLFFSALIFIPSVAGANAGLFVLFTASAILVGYRTRSPAMSIAGGFAVFSIAASFFIWNDHWQFITALLYGCVFLTAAGLVYNSRRRVA
jgi:hypothetical protein